MSDALSCGPTATLASESLYLDYGYSSSDFARPRVYPGSVVLLDAARAHRRFELLAAAWERDTINFSSPRDMFENSNYIAIISMGEKVLPFLLARLAGQEPDFWFYALHKITGATPTSESDAGSVRRMADAWLAWGRNNNII